MISKTLRLSVLVTPVAVACIALSASSAGAQNFIQRNLVSDGFTPAATIDANLVNPWGISASGTSPFWLSNNGTGTSTLYRTNGAKVPLTVAIPGAGGAAASAPTGQVFNSSTQFITGVNPARFIFATEDGTISAWNGGTKATLKVDNSASGSIYKGLAIGNVGKNSFLYAADFANNRIDVFDGGFAPTSLTGNFVDPTAPVNYAPFNIQNLGGKLFVTYAKTGGGADEVDGAGFGFVSEFDTNGNFVKRIASGTDAGGTVAALNAPWGLAIAPNGFGGFGGDLLVGNFGNGQILAFDAQSGAFDGALRDANGNILTIDGLWALQVGNGAAGGFRDKVYFTAGPGGELHGLFGSLAAAPEPGTISLMLLGSVTFAGGLIKRYRKS